MYSPLSSFMRTPEQQRARFVSFSPSSNTSLSLAELQGSSAPLTPVSLLSNLSEGSMHLLDTTEHGASQWDRLDSFSMPSSSTEFFESSIGTNTSCDDDSFRMNGFPIVSASQWTSTKLAMFRDEHPPTPTPNAQPMRKLSPEQANKSDTDANSDSQSLSFSASTSTATSIAAPITNTRRVRFVEPPKRNLHKYIIPNIQLPLESPGTRKPDYISSSYRQLVAIAPPPKSPLVRRKHAVLNTAQTA
jgi:hypothetical protein